IRPVRRSSSDNVIGDKWNDYLKLLSNDTSDALDELQLKWYCCRRIVLTHVDSIEQLLHYNPMERTRDKSHFVSRRSRISWPAFSIAVFILSSGSTHLISSSLRCRRA
ncbi:hypothetical protein IW261DRAFT_1340726, partial [Armillaria novae-zelandiae]